MLGDVDVVVVGTGCTGGWVAKRLTESGVRVLVLDAGPRVDAESMSVAIYSGYGTPTTSGWRPAASQSVQARHWRFREATEHLFVDDLEHPYTTPADKPFDWIRGRQVGGRSLTWGGICLRLSDFELGAGSLDGLSEDWPIRYADLSPYYSMVERFMQVRGSPESLPQLPDGEFLPSVEMSAAEQYLQARIRERWPDRAVIPRRGIGFEPATDMPWPRFTSQGSTLAAAEATGLLRLQSDCVVTRLLSDPGTGRVRGLTVVDRSTLVEKELHARIVVMCASTIETARILLNSSTREHPAGLGNASGVLGCFLMDHFILGLHGRGDLPAEPRELRSGGANGAMIPRFRNVGSDRQKYSRGFGISVEAARYGLPRGVCQMYAYGEMLPCRTNRVTLNPTRKDRWGVPVAHIEYTRAGNDLAMISDARECLIELANQTGLEILAINELSNPGLTVHEMGTARMGSDPSTSFVNPRCQSWELPNLFVADGSVFTTGGWQNPSLTMMALAARTADVIVEEMKDGRI